MLKAAWSRISVEMGGSGFIPAEPGSCTRELELDSGTSLLDLAAAIGLAGRMGLRAEVVAAYGEAPPHYPGEGD